MRRVREFEDRLEGFLGFIETSVMRGRAGAALEGIADARALTRHFIADNFEPKHDKDDETDACETL